jgi:hypothetical protein
MHLHLAQPFLSLTDFPDCEIPDLTIIHGQNGAGKTHMLKALEAGFYLQASEGDKALSCLYASDFGETDPLKYDGFQTNQFHAGNLELIKKTYSENQILSEIIEKYIDKDQRWAFGYTGYDFAVGFSAVPHLRDLAIAKAMSEKSELVDDLNRSVIVLLRRDNVDLSNRLEKAINFLGISISDIKIEDLYDDQWNPIDSSMLSPRIGYLFRRYWNLWISHKQLQIRSKSLGGDVPNDKDFEEKHGSAPWTSYNDRLSDLGIEFSFSDPPEDYTLPWNLYLVKDGIKVGVGEISSGERVILNLALSTLAKEDKKFQMHKPDLILLDEPDAHLHPSLVKKMFDRVIYPLVRDGTKIIITTHSPTTIAQSPEGAIFEKITNGGIVHTTKQGAIDRLLVGVPHISINPTGRRQVFVESTEDEIIYQEIYDNIRNELKNDRSLTFIGVGKEKDGGKDNLKKTVRRLRDSGNIGIYGIVDWDGVELSKNYIFVSCEGEFRSIENVTLNPLIIGAMLVRDGGLEEFSSWKFVNLQSASESCLQELSDRVSSRLIGMDSGENISVPLMGGLSINIPTILCSMNGHEYEGMLLEKFPKLKAVQNLAPSKSLKRFAVKSIICEIPVLCPKSLGALFQNILSSS